MKCHKCKCLPFAQQDCRGRKNKEFFLALNKGTFKPNSMLEYHWLHTPFFCVKLNFCNKGAKVAFVTVELFCHFLHIHELNELRFYTKFQQNPTSGSKDIYLFKYINCCIKRTISMFLTSMDLSFSYIGEPGDDRGSVVRSGVYPRHQGGGGCIGGLCSHRPPPLRVRPSLPPSPGRGQQQTHGRSHSTT